MLSNNSKWLRLAGSGLLGFALCSCAAPTPRPTVSGRVQEASEPRPAAAAAPVLAAPSQRTEPAGDALPQAHSAPPDEPAAPPATPRMLASLQLTEQGKALLDRKKPDDAIAVLERAVQLNPGSGQNYFYIAEAWIMKSRLDQAREYNRLAGMYLAADPSWVSRVEAQARRVASGLP